MSRFLTLSAFILSACEPPPAAPCPECPVAPPPVAPSGAWDAKAGAQQKSAVEAMFKAMDSGNGEYFAKHADEDVVLFDVNAEGKPVARRGKRALEYVERATKDMKDAGTSVQTTLGRTDCHGTDTVGFCAVEYKQVVTTNGKAGEPMDFFGTTVMHKVGDDWKLSHWRGGPGVESREGPEDGAGGKAPDDRAKGGKQGKKEP